MLRLLVDVLGSLILSRADVGGASGSLGDGGLSYGDSGTPGLDGVVGDCSYN